MQRQRRWLQHPGRNFSRLFKEHLDCRALLLLRQAELYAALLIQLGCGIRIQRGERNLHGTLLVKNPQRLPYDRIVLDFLDVLVAEDQCGRLMRRGFLLCLRCRWRIRGRGASRQFFPQALHFVAQAVDLLRHFAHLLVGSIRRITGGIGVPKQRIRIRSVVIRPDVAVPPPGRRRKEEPPMVVKALGKEERLAKGHAEAHAGAWSPYSYRAAAGDHRTSEPCPAYRRKSSRCRAHLPAAMGSRPRMPAS